MAPTFFTGCPRDFPDSNISDDKDLFKHLHTVIAFFDNHLGNLSTQHPDNIEKLMKICCQKQIFVLQQ